MAHNILIMIVEDIDESVARLNTRFKDGIFNTVIDDSGNPVLNGNGEKVPPTKRQIDGYVVDENEIPTLPKTLCQDDNYLLYLCRGAADPSAAVQKILDSSYELKTSEYRVMRDDPLSEWYAEPEVDL